MYDDAKLSNDLSPESIALNNNIIKNDKEQIKTPTRSLHKNDIELEFMDPLLHNDETVGTIKKIEITNGVKIIEIDNNEKKNDKKNYLIIIFLLFLNLLNYIDRYSIAGINFTDIKNKNLQSFYFLRCFKSNSKIFRY
jgi:hypothetical protein